MLLTRPSILKGERKGRFERGEGSSSLKEGRRRENVPFHPMYPEGGLKKNLKESKVNGRVLAPSLGKKRPGLARRVAIRQARGWGNFLWVEISSNSGGSVREINDSQRRSGL